MSPDREELALFRELFEGYDKRLRPALRKEDNVTVTLGISVNQLIDIVSGIWLMFPSFICTSASVHNCQCLICTKASGAVQTTETNNSNWTVTLLRIPTGWSHPVGYSLALPRISTRDYRETNSPGQIQVAGPEFEPGIAGVLQAHLLTQRRNLFRKVANHAFHTFEFLSGLRETLCGLAWKNKLLTREGKFLLILAQLRKFTLSYSCRYDLHTRKISMLTNINAVFLVVLQDERNQMMRLSVWVRQVGPNNLPYTKCELISEAIWESTN